VSCRYIQCVQPAVWQPRANEARRSPARARVSHLTRRQPPLPAAAQGGGVPERPGVWARVTRMCWQQLLVIPVRRRGATTLVTLHFGDPAGQAWRCPATTAAGPPATYITLATMQQHPKHHRRSANTEPCGVTLPELRQPRHHVETQSGEVQASAGVSAAAVNSSLGVHTSSQVLTSAALTRSHTASTCDGACAHAGSARIVPGAPSSRGTVAPLHLTGSFVLRPLHTPSTHPVTATHHSSCLTQRAPPPQV
jgi:hypothetical protein